jgi:hypothetical protein
MGLEMRGTEVGLVRGKGLGGVPTGLVRLELGVLVGQLGGHLELGVGHKVSSVALPLLDLLPLLLRDLERRLGMLVLRVLSRGVTGDTEGVSSLHQTRRSPAVRRVEPSTETETSVTQEEWRGRGVDRGRPEVDSQI